MGHLLDCYSEQHCGADLLYWLCSGYNLTEDSLGWWVKGMWCALQARSPLSPSVYLPFRKSASAGFRSQWWPEPRNHNEKEPHRDTAPFSAFYEGLEIKWVSGTMQRAKEWGPLSWIFKDVAVDGPTCPQTQTEVWKGWGETWSPLHTQLP